MAAPAQADSLALVAAEAGARVPGDEIARDAEGWVPAAAAYGLLAVLVAASLVAAWRLRVIGPGALRQAGGREVGFHPWWYWFLAAVGVAFGREFGAAVVITAGDAAGLARESLRLDALVTACGSAVAIGVGVLLVWLSRRGAPDAARAGLRARPLDVPVGVLGLAIAMPLVYLAGAVGMLLHVLKTGEQPDAIAHATLTEIMGNCSDPWVWVLIGAATVLGPVVEELVFRVFLQSSLLRLTRRPWAAVLVTAALFALMHRAGPEPVPWHAIGSLFVLGAAMGAAYERTRRLGVPMVMHAMFNAGNVAAALW